MQLAQSTCDGFGRPRGISLEKLMLTKPLIFPGDKQIHTHAHTTKRTQSSSYTQTHTKNAL